MTTKERKAIASVGVLVVVYGALLLWVWPIRGLDAWLVRDAEANLRAAPLGAERASLQDDADGARMKALWCSALCEDELAEAAAWHGGGAREAVESGLDHAWRFLRHVSSDDPEAYASWAEAQGLRARFPHPDRWGHEHWAQRYERLMGEPAPPGLDARTYALAAMRAHNAQQGGVMHLRSLLLDEGAVHVTVSRADRRGHGFEYKSLSRLSGLGGDFWYGPIALGWHNFWTPALGVKELIERDGAVLVMRVNAVAISASGQVAPLHMHLYLDRRAGTWRVSMVGFGNIARDVMLGVF
ncbi:MAG: hypothetical protein EA379_10335 [Phycisphaerales bacterium]|nr:MAG: hypothetical protein EA379_10335 [Phycisphaerales bacterium]